MARRSGRTQACSPAEARSRLAHARKFAETADLVATGRHEERVQDESQATYEGWMHDEEAEIHWPGEHHRSDRALEAVSA